MPLSQPYEVFALRMAADPSRTVRQNFFFDAWPSAPDTLMPQDYYFWVIRGDQRLLVVDTGFNPKKSKNKGRSIFAEPRVLLADLGIDPNGVTDLIMTHLHWDHAGNIDQFSGARIHLQEAEMRYCTGPAMSHAAVNKIYDRRDIEATITAVFEGRVHFHVDEVEIAPGVTVHRVGGHTPGSQLVRVRTRRGDIVLASDAAHFWANIKRSSPFPILESFPHALDAFETTKRLASYQWANVIPGHDPLVGMRFPPWKGHPNIFALHEEPLCEIE